jgi:hypothetical protein
MSDMIERLRDRYSTRSHSQELRDEAASSLMTSGYGTSPCRLGATYSTRRETQVGTIRE